MPECVKTASGRPIYGTADLNAEVGLMKVLTRTSAGQIDADEKSIYKHRQVSLQKIMQYKPTENNLRATIPRT